MYMLFIARERHVSSSVMFRLCYDDVYFDKWHNSPEEICHLGRTTDIYVLEYTTSIHTRPFFPYILLKHFDLFIFGAHSGRCESNAKTKPTMQIDIEADQIKFVLDRLLDISYMRCDAYRLCIFFFLLGSYVTC